MNELSNQERDHDQANPHIFPIKVYLTVFGILISFFFLNILIYKSHLPVTFSFIFIMTVALVQALLVVLFFMELVHEDKFYLFAFGSCIFFIVLFMAVSLTEITGRSFFHPDEGAHILKEFDQNGIYAPAGPLKPNTNTGQPATNTEHRQKSHRSSEKK